MISRAPSLVGRPWRNLPTSIDYVGADLLQLPDGRVLPDACIWRGFMQSELGIDPETLWKFLLQIPTWPDEVSPYSYCVSSITTPSGVTTYA